MSRALGAIFRLSVVAGQLLQHRICLIERHAAPVAALDARPTCIKLVKNALALARASSHLFFAGPNDS
jgi:hypothetical protein